MFDHRDAVLDDKQEVDSCQRRQTLPHAVELCEQIHALLSKLMLTLTVVVGSLRLENKCTGLVHWDRKYNP